MTLPFSIFYFVIIITITSISCNILCRFPNEDQGVNLKYNLHELLQSKSQTALKNQVLQITFSFNCETVNPLDDKTFIFERILLRPSSLNQLKGPLSQTGNKKYPAKKKNQSFQADKQT